MKFKVGDRVRVKSKKEIEELYGGNARNMPGDWHPDMDNFCGKIGRITSALPGCPAGCYCVRFYEEDCERTWNYDSRCLIPVQNSLQEPIIIMFENDSVIATEGQKSATVRGQYKNSYDKQAGAIEAIKKLYRPFPQTGDDYYFVRISVQIGGKAKVGNHLYADDDADKKYRESGNFFETEEEAQVAVDKINSIFENQLIFTANSH